MSDRSSSLLRLTALAAALALAGCSGGDEGNLANLDNKLVANDADPALTSALADQILVDPGLAQQSNRNAVRPPATPTQAQYPADSGQDSGTRQGASAQGASASGATRLASAGAGSDQGGCTAGATFDYNIGWARRLSPAFPVYPGGRVTDAAANNKDGCRMRVVTFTSGEPPASILGWYKLAAERAGYSAQETKRAGDRILGGVNDRDGGAFYLIVTPRRSGGSEVALFANNGR